MNSSSTYYENLISEFASLPGIGKKSASRLAYYLINQPEERINQFIKAISEGKNKIKHCKICYSLSDDDICNICKNEKRDRKVIMIVENERDLLAYEDVGEYKGVYHVLGGALSPLTGIGPDELRIKELIIRIQNEVDEIIIATNSSIEGEATATYLIKLLKPFNIKISKIAQGVPVGGDIENIDGATLTRALNSRIKVN